MSYRLNRTDGELLVDLTDGILDLTTTDLTLIGKNYKGFGEFLNEVSRSPVSGTKAGWTDSLEDKKYELTKDVKGVQIGDFTNVTLPKGTIIYNLPGGVFAYHFSLKQKYTGGYSSQQPKWVVRFGIMIRQMPDTLASIEKNGKVLESVVNEELLNPGNLPSPPSTAVSDN